MKEIIISRNNVNVDYEVYIAAEVTETKKHPHFGAEAIVSNIDRIFAFHKDHADFRRMLRVWAGVYGISDPSKVLTVKICQRIKDKLAEEGYQWNVTWQKANNPFTSVLIKEEDKN